MSCFPEASTRKFGMTLNMANLCLLASMVSNEKSAANLTEGFLHLNWQDFIFCYQEE